MNALSPTPPVRRAYWQVTALLLATHFAGWRHGLPAAIALNVVQTVHFSLARGTWRAFDLQLRWFYLGLLGLGLLPLFGWVHVVQFVGVNAMLVTDYCPAARLLVLMPWNRDVPLGFGLVRWALLSPPAPGSIAERLRNQGQPAFSTRPRAEQPAR
jgi:hypothetical protein